MADLKKVLEGTRRCPMCRIRYLCNGCPYREYDGCVNALIEDAHEILEEQEKEIKALKLLLGQTEERESNN